LTIYTLIQQEEVQKVTRKIRIRPQNKPNENAPKKLNAKAYAMTIKEDKVLN